MARRSKRKYFSNGLLLIRVLIQPFKSPIFISWILAIAGLVALTAMSVPKLRAKQISTANLRVTFNSPPIWIDDSLLQELQDVARIHLSQTAVGRDGLIKTVDALESTGWFHEVMQVQWVNESEAVIDGSFLIPYAKVMDSEGIVYIDVQGRRLPTRVGKIVKPKYHFITLSQPCFYRPQRAGMQWTGDDILSALNLLKLLYDKPWATQIKTIDLSTWTQDGSLTLLTDTPSKLIWGSAPNEERRLEALASDKISRLNWLFNNFGSVDKDISAEFNLTDVAEITIQ